MLPDRVSNPGPLTYESDALPIALRGPGTLSKFNIVFQKLSFFLFLDTSEELYESFATIKQMIYLPKIIQKQTGSKTNYYDIFAHRGVRGWGLAFIGIYMICTILTENIQTLALFP